MRDKEDAAKGRLEKQTIPLSLLQLALPPQAPPPVTLETLTQPLQLTNQEGQPISVSIAPATVTLAPPQPIQAAVVVVGSVEQVGPTGELEKPGSEVLLHEIRSRCVQMNLKSLQIRFQKSQPVTTSVKSGPDRNLNRPRSITTTKPFSAQKPGPVLIQRRNRVQFSGNRTDFLTHSDLFQSKTRQNRKNVFFCPHRAPSPSRAPTR